MDAPIVWKPFYSVRDASLDAQHQRIIGIINDLYVAMDQGRDLAATKTALDRLIQYTNEHFKHEERVMQEHDYPELVEHKALHDQLRKRTVDLRAHVSLITSRDLLNFLKCWWVEHIQNCDKQFAPYLSVPVHS
jgi:hemerythrin